MTNYFLIFHVGHGAGGWLMRCCNNHKSSQIWLIGEVDRPNQLNRDGEEWTGEDKDTAIQGYFEDADHRKVDACGIVKSFRRQAFDFVREQKGRWVQMIRNPLSKCGHRVIRLDRKEAATLAFTQEYGRAPTTHMEMVEGHMISFRRKHYDHFLHRARKYRHKHRWPILRMEDLNWSLSRDGVLFKRFMEWLTQVDWPEEYVDLIREKFLPNKLYKNTVRWCKNPDARTGRIRVAKPMTAARTWGFFQERGRVWGSDPESINYWNEWDEQTKFLYRKWFGDLEDILGYNQSYPGSVHQGWEFYGAYEWGGLYDQVD
jgi:hypothetical protein